MYLPLPPDILKNNAKVALITGASQGIGAEIAASFIQKGYFVILVDCLEHLGLEQEARWQGKAKFYPCDLSDQTKVDNLCEILQAEFPIIDTIIHNAKSPAKEREILRNLESEWDTSFRVMLKHPIRINQLLLPILKKSVNPSILFIGSTNAHFVSQQPLSYHVVKGALSQTIRYLACEYAPFKIRVNVIHPGLVDIPGRKKKDPVQFQKIVDHVVPLQRAITAAEIGYFCIFYSSPEASYLTGSSLDLDGGEHLKDHFHLMMSHLATETPALNGNSR